MANELTTSNPPTRPCTPDLLRRLLADGRIGLKTIGPNTQAMAREHILALNDYLRPAEPERALARITTLLAHYWTPSMPENLQEAVAMDWCEVCDELPGWALFEACGQWLREKRKRPSPADIVHLVAERIGNAKMERDKLQSIMMTARRDGRLIPDRAAAQEVKAG